MFVETTHLGLPFKEAKISLKGEDSIKYQAVAASHTTKGIKVIFEEASDSPRSGMALSVIYANFGSPVSSTDFSAKEYEDIQVTPILLEQP